jgi:hypothetical protein
MYYYDYCELTNSKKSTRLWRTGDHTFEAIIIIINNIVIIIVLLFITAVCIWNTCL